MAARKTGRDGGTSTSQNPPHTYQNPGAYEAVVTAIEMANLLEQVEGAN